MKKIIKRVKAEETRLGKLLAYYLPSLLAIVATTVEVLEQLQSMPFEIGLDTKKWIAILTLVSFVAGKLTKKQNE